MMRRLSPGTEKPTGYRDPYLHAALLCAAILSGFWIWYRVPNFGTADEYSRLVRPMKVAGWTLSEGGLGGLERGFLDGRTLGASTYLYALVLVPIGLYVVLTGRLEAFASFGEFQSRWDLWFAAPEWYWTASILLARAVVVALAVGCVYLTYCLGRRIADRTGARVAALLLALSLGFASTAHEAGEDVPMLFVLLLSLLFVLRYVDTGRRRTLVVASGLGGLAIAFKLTAGVIVFVIGGALLARARTEGDVDRELVGHAIAGLLAGLVVFVVGMPSVLLGGPDRLVTRVVGAGGGKVAEASTEPTWSWILRQYANGLGLPLLFGAGVGSAAALGRAIERARTARYDLALLASALITYLLVFSLWGYVRVHHLLPTIPLLCLLLGTELSERYPTIGAPTDDIDLPTIAVGLLVLSTALYAGVGVVHYANEPRDQATQWLDEHADDGATVEVYEDSVAEVGVPHHLDVSRYTFREDGHSYDGALVANESAYTDWMVSMPERQPDYIQLTAAELQYLDSSGDEFPERRAYVRGLLDGEYEYRVVARYGVERPEGDVRIRWIRAGTNPVPDKIAPQIVILERTGE